MPSFGRDVKPFAPYHRFAACKRSLNGINIMKNMTKKSSLKKTRTLKVNTAQ
jgi:hypothetical protein